MLDAYEIAKSDLVASFKLVLAACAGAKVKLFKEVYFKILVHKYL